MVTDNILQQISGFLTQINSKIESLASADLSDPAKMTFLQLAMNQFSMFVAMKSNILKTMQDASMSVIRNITA
jgi:type III secretion apparatus needle protein